MVLAVSAVVVGIAGVVLLDLRDDVLIGEEPNTAAGTIGAICLAVAIVLLAAAVLWTPVRRARQSLRRDEELQRRSDQAFEETMG